MKFEFKIKEIHKVYATDFVQKYHYSPVMPGITKHYLGFFLDKELKGVLTLGWGTKPRHTFNKMFPSFNILVENKEEPLVNYYFEIGKMCLSDDLNKTNAGSQMVSITIQWLKENTKCMFLYTMADGIMGKCGYIYQASNFYFGEKYWTSVYLMENGEKLHPRTSTQLCIENAEFSGRDKIFWLTSAFMKHKGIHKINGLMFRYIYPLNKSTKKIMMKESSMNWTRNYPKDVDLEWLDVTDMKNKISISKPAFTFENAKYNLKNINAHKGEANLEEFFGETEHVASPTREIVSALHE